jgi:hypothetical protein
MMPASSFNHLFSDADGPLGSIFLDCATPTPSGVLLHCLVVTSSLIETSQAKSTYGHWRMKMQCKSDLKFHYWKSPADLPAYLSYKVKALNPTTLIPVKPHIRVLCTKSVGCILLVTQYIDPVNASTPDPPVITLVTAQSMANIGSISHKDSPGVL